MAKRFRMPRPGRHARPQQHRDARRRAPRRAASAGARRSPASGCTSSTAAASSATSASPGCPRSAASRSAPSACTRASAGSPSCGGRPSSRMGEPRAVPRRSHALPRAGTIPAHARGHRLRHHLGAARAGLRLRLRPGGRPSFTDHFMEDYRLARVHPVGVGAAARFKLDAPARERVRRADDHEGRPAAPDRRGDPGRAARPQPLGRGLRLHARVGERHPRGADHLQRAGHRRRPPQGDRRRRAGSGARPGRRSTACG